MSELDNSGKRELRSTERNLEIIADSLRSIRNSAYYIALTVVATGFSYCTHSFFKPLADHVYVTNMPSEISVPSNR